MLCDRCAVLWVLELLRMTPSRRERRLETELRDELALAATADRSAFDFWRSTRVIAKRWAAVPTG